MLEEESCSDRDRVPSNAAVVVGSALFKECHIIPKKDKKWQFLPQINNVVLHFCLQQIMKLIFSSTISR